jgi:hypothetical protein
MRMEDGIGQMDWGWREDMAYKRHSFGLNFTTSHTYLMFRFGDIAGLDIPHDMNGS